MKRYWAEIGASDELAEPHYNVAGKQLVCLASSVETEIEKARKEGWADGHRQAATEWAGKMAEMRLGVHAADCGLFHGKGDCTCESPHPKEFKMAESRKQGAEEERTKIRAWCEANNLEISCSRVMDAYEAHLSQPPAPPRLPEKLRGPVYNVQQTVNALIDYLKARE